MRGRFSAGLERLRFPYSPAGMQRSDDGSESLAASWRIVRAADWWNKVK